jgi:hypothetical protein
MTEAAAMPKRALRRVNEGKATAFAGTQAFGMAELPQSAYDGQNHVTRHRR